MEDGEDGWFPSMKWEISLITPVVCLFGWRCGRRDRARLIAAECCSVIYSCRVIFNYLMKRHINAPALTVCLISRLRPDTHMHVLVSQCRQSDFCVPLTPCPFTAVQVKHLSHAIPGAAGVAQSCSTTRSSC